MIKLDITIQIHEHRIGPYSNAIHTIHESDSQLTAKRRDRPELRPHRALAVRGIGSHLWAHLAMATTIPLDPPFASSPSGQCAP